jgi:hypothetical protein
VRARILGLLLLAAPKLAMAGATIRAEVDAKKIGVGDQLQLTVSVEGSGFRLLEEVAAPRLQNLRVVAGPSVSTQISVVNGAMSQGRISTWILQPIAVGKAEVGPVKARFDDGEKVTEPIAIEVVAGSVRPRREPAPDPFGEDPFEALLGQRRGRVREPKVFVEAAVSRTRLRVGEPVLLTYWLYTQVPVSDYGFVDAPAFPGFWRENLEAQPAQGTARVTVDGEVYQRAPLASMLLFPTKAGRLTILGATMRLGLPRQSFFDSGGVVQRATKDLTLTVDPIPETPGFSGAVGRFRVTAAVDKPALALGEAATLRFKVEGTGNLKWIDKAPEVAVPGAKVYPPQVKSDLRPSASGISGSRTWEFVVVPETAGDLRVPALTFSYFDSASGRVESTSTEPIAIRVDGGTAAAGLPTTPAPAALPRAGAPLPLRTDLDGGRMRFLDMGPTALGGAVTVALLAHGLIFNLGAFGRKGRRTAGPASRRSVRAALSELDLVGRDGLTKEAAATLIEKALVEAFGPLDPNESETTEGVEAARSLLEEVHFVRYAPQLGDYSEKLRELAARASATVKRWA